MAGVRNFVRQKNNVPDTGIAGIDGSYEDLRIPKNGKGPSRDDKLSTKSKRHSHARRGHGQLYDTDTSDLGDTSTTASMDHKQIKEEPMASQKYDPPEYFSSSRDGSEEGSLVSEGAAEYGDKLQAEPVRLGHEERDQLRQFEHRPRDALNGAWLPHTDGDTYPETTSGRPSDDSIPEESSDQHHRQDLPPDQHGDQLPSSNRSTAPLHMDHAHAQPRPPIFFNRATDGASEPKIDAYSSKPTLPIPSHQARSNLQQPNGVHRMQPIQSLRNVPGPKAMGPPAAPVHNAQHQGIDPRSIEQALHAHSKRTKTADRSRSKERMSKPAKKNRESTRHGKILETPGEPTQPSSKVQDPEEQADAEPYYVDYQLDELYSMDYDELKAESYDSDPDREEIVLPEVQESDPLEEKMSAAAQLAPQTQVAFFNGLSLVQWEQAGDWFLGRFGEVMEKLKTARQERRQVSGRLEGEIEVRHGSVVKKRKHIEAALAGMRENGGKVLENTPKKTRKG